MRGLRQGTVDKFTRRPSQFVPGLKLILFVSGLIGITISLILEEVGRPSIVILPYYALAYFTSYKLMWRTNLRLLDNLIVLFLSVSYVQGFIAYSIFTGRSMSLNMVDRDTTLGVISVALVGLLIAQWASSKVRPRFETGMLGEYSGSKNKVLFYGIACLCIGSFGTILTLIASSRSNEALSSAGSLVTLGISLSYLTSISIILLAFAFSSASNKWPFLLFWLLYAVQTIHSYQVSTGRYIMISFGIISLYCLKILGINKRILYSLIIGSILFLPIVNMMSLGARFSGQTLGDLLSNPISAYDDYASSLLDNREARLYAFDKGINLYYLNMFDSFGTGVLERLLAPPWADVIVGNSGGGIFGFAPLFRIFASALPGPFVSNKLLSFGDEITWDLGLVPNGISQYANTTAIAELYVIGGVILVLVGSFGLYFLVFSQLRFFSCNDVFNAIPFVLFFNFANMWSGGGLLVLILFAMRIVPLYLTVAAALKWLIADNGKAVMIRPRPQSHYGLGTAPE